MSARSRAGNSAHRIAAALCAALCALVVAPVLPQASAGPVASSSASSSANVIISAIPGQLRAVGAAVEHAGGRILRALPIIDGFSARIPSSLLVTLQGDSRVRLVSSDRTLHAMGIQDGTVGGSGLADTGAMAAVTRIVGARDLWDSNITGKGVDIALIDTGVAPVPGFQDRIVNGPDLSFDYQVGAPPYVDAFGHGTHLAGIIAGRDDNAKIDGNDTGSAFIGVAPEARIVNVKVGAFNGAADVSQVIAAIDWVVQHRQDHGLNIRVLNLSYGTDGSQDYRTDPLAYAVEVAWRKGLVVVVAGGNQGTTASLANPALDPTVIAVGASDPKGTLDRTDDVVTDWSSRGSVTRHVDVVAPGVSIKSLAVPGSFVATAHPESIVGNLLKGSGTSQAAAVVSGVAALLLQKHPNSTPDGIKSLLQASAFPMPGSTPLDRGAGEVDAAKAVKISGGFGRKLPPPPLQATGTGSLEGARGSVHVAIGSNVLSGERDIFGGVWDGSSWSGQSWSGSSWSGGLWMGRQWSGSSWSGSSWSGSSWSDAAWDGSSWSGQSWSDQSWSGSSWSGSSWSGQSWSGSSWSGSSWSGSSWSGSSWSGRSWASVDW